MTSKTHVPRGNTIVLALAALFLLLVVGGGLVLFNKYRALPAPAVETAQQRYDETKKAFATTTPAATVVDPAPLLAQLDLCSAMMQGRQPRDIVKVFDAERATREIERLPGTNVTRQERGQLVEGMKAMMGNVLAGTTALAPWTQCTIKRVQVLDTPNDVVVYAKLSYDGFGVRYRFWMHRDGPWRIYDFEELDTSGRLSSIFAGMLPMLRGGNMASIQAFAADGKRIGNAIRLLGEGNPDAAAAELDRVKPDAMPPRFQFMYHLGKTMLACHTGEYAVALQHTKQARPLEPESPVLASLESIAYHGTGEYEASIKSADQSIAMMGPSDVACQYKAKSLLELGRREEARTACEQGLADEPGSADLTLLLLDLIPEDQHGTIGKRFADANPSMPAFHLLADALVTARDQPALESVAVAYEDRMGVSYDTSYYRATATLLKGDAKAAVKMFEPLLKNPPERYKGVVQDSYDAAVADSAQADVGATGAAMPTTAP